MTVTGAAGTAPSRLRLKDAICAGVRTAGLITLAAVKAGEDGP
jgi:hypothetical protein